jgi:glycosidase
MKRKGLTALLTCITVLMMTVACGGGGKGGAGSQSTEARLAAIELGNAAYDSSFDPDGAEFSAELESDNPVCTIVVEKMHPRQSVFIGTQAATSGSVTVSGQTADVAIKVIAEDGVSQKTYLLHVRKPVNPDENAYLSALSASGISLSPSFQKGVFAYGASVNKTVTSTTISWTKGSALSTVKFDGSLITETSKLVTLVTGTNTFLIEVTSENGNITNPYTVKIIVEDPVSSLKSISVSSGDLVPQYAPDTYLYNVSFSCEYITVTPTAYADDAVITVDGATVESGEESDEIYFTVGEKKNIVVALQGGNSYTIKAERINPDLSAYLDSLVLSSGAISFDKLKFAYDGIEVENGVASVSVTPTAISTSATITVNGAAVSSGAATQVALAEGKDNLIDITVTNGEVSKTYFAVVTRKGQGGTSTGVWINVLIPSTWGWSGPFIHYWSASKTYTTWANCPTMTNEGNDWYSFNVTEENTINVICKGKQENPGLQTTGDQTGLTGEVYLTAGTGGWVKSTNRPDGAPSHQGWTAPKRPTITFAPDALEVESGTVVSITNTPVSGTVAKSGYLVDGTKYAGSSFSISKACSVLAYAENSSGGITVTPARAYTLATPKPIITITPPSGTTFTDTIDVSIDVKKADTKEYSIDGGAWKALTVTSMTLGADKNVGEKVSIEVRASNTYGQTLSGKYEYTKMPVGQSVFSWDNATVYFAITDRFKDGNAANNGSYGRPQMDATGKNIGTFHGGDLVGLTQKINDGYFTDLGVNAIWFTAAYEQIHGWVGGGSGDFAHYAYHGYYALDYTAMDKNMGTVNEMRAFVTAAHNKGIRVVMDVVVNHVGYETFRDMEEYGFGDTGGLAYTWTPTGGQNWQSHHSAGLDSGKQNATAWAKWWGSSWIRAVNIAGYSGSVGSGIESCLDYLPDVKTEAGAAGIPPLLVTKWNKETSGYGDWIVPGINRSTSQNKRPKEFLAEWLAGWVREFGIDGFRVDTVKHVETDVLQDLANAAQQALLDWRSSSRSNGDPAKNWTEDFWMTGEHWNFPGENGGRNYFNVGFDNMIDFGFKSSVPMDGNAMKGSHDYYKDKKYLPYISSHDTGSVFYNGDAARQKKAGTALLLTPSPVQIFYGDEIGRSNGNSGSDPNQGSRSAMNWTSINNDILQHWQKLGKFRNKHVAIGAGTHTKLSDSPYVFSRVKGTDKVVVVIEGSGTAVNVSSVFSNGTVVRNAYSGTTATVTDGKVAFTGDVILIEANN